MTENVKKTTESTAIPAINKADFTPGSMADSLRVDLLCKQLLHQFYATLVNGGMPPVEATLLASGADYFVRDFVVDFKRLNLFEEHPGIVRQFAGNWYIVSTIEPDLRQLAEHLQGVAAFYRYLGDRGLISAGYREAIERECADLDYYGRRIASFWEIAGDGYMAWERECSLKEASGGENTP